MAEAGEAERSGGFLPLLPVDDDARLLTNQGRETRTVLSMFHEDNLGSIQLILGLCSPGT